MQLCERTWNRWCLEAGRSLRLKFIENFIENCIEAGWSLRLKFIENFIENCAKGWAARGCFINLTKLRAELVKKPAYAGN